MKAVTDSIRKEWETQPNSTQQLDAAHFIVTRGEDLYLKMLLQDGLMHSDLHPGNKLSMFECWTRSYASVACQEI